MNAKRASKRIVASILSLMLVFSCFVIPAVSVNAADETVVNIHYHRADGDYADWNIWTWTDGGGAIDHEPPYQFGEQLDENGAAVATITVVESTQRLGFIVRTDQWAKDPDGDRFIDMSGVISGTVDVYCESGSALNDFTVDYSNAVMGMKLKSAGAKNRTTIEYTLTSAPTADEPVTIADFALTNAKGEAIELTGFTNDGVNGTLTVGTELDYLKDYTISFRGVSISLAMPDYFSSEEFESQYTYDGNDLGATYSPESTAFRVWAPTANKVELNLYEAGNGGKAYSTVEMTKDVKGTWVTTVAGDLNKKYYTYNAYFDGKTNKDIVDPYARTVGVNGARGEIVDLDSTDPEGWETDTRHTYKNPTDLEIYELHVRDFSVAANSGITNKGKYIAFTETGTTTPDGQKTGIDYLKDLGVTSVHILPSYDYGSVDETKLDTKAQYNWGYDPVNYNSPEGSYSTDPYNGEVRVNEYKQMVQALHNAGIGVIMDVVYNHTYNTNYCFEKLVPGYFYRPGSNGSGCGNDVASERSMVSKFISDSVAYWADEYHLDGFRFDLMGLIDVDTMNDVRAKVDKVDDEIFIYGEGWSMSTLTTKKVQLATQLNSALTPGIAYFSDTIRDMIKGSVFDAAEKGYVNGETKHNKAIINTVQYSKKWSPSPTQTINYSDCHDNLTLWDKIRSSNGDDSEEDQIRQNLFAAAIVHTAQGVPFMMSGEEFLRTKTKADGTFEHNSYASPDSVNELDYSRASTYSDVYNYYKGLIQFRKAHPAFRLTTAEDVTAAYADNYDEKGTTITSLGTYNAEKGVAVYKIDATGVKGETADEFMVVYNPLYTDTIITLPEGQWSVLVNDKTAGTEELSKETGSVSVPKLSAMVLAKNLKEKEEMDPNKKITSAADIANDGHTVGVVGSFSGWKDDIELVDDDGSGMYRSKLVINEVTEDMLLDGALQFKVRLDGQWTNSWGDYEAEYDRTFDSQTNFRVDCAVGDKVTIMFKFYGNKDINGNTGDDADFMLLAVEYDAKVETPEPEYVLGDINSDGTADIADALMAARYDAGLMELPSETAQKAGDVTGDGVVNIADALKIARFDAQLITEL